MFVKSLLIVGFVTVLLNLGCSGDQRTEIQQKGGGKGPSNQFPTKAAKTKYDSLGQVSLTLASFVELEILIQNLLREDLTRDGELGSCPRRKSSGSDGLEHYFTLHWEGCKGFAQRFGADEITLTTTEETDSLTLDNIESLSLSSNVAKLQSGAELDASKEESDIILPYYLYFKKVIFFSPEIKMTKLSSNSQSTVFRLQSELQLIHQKSKKAALSFYSSIVAQVTVPKNSNLKVSYDIQSAYSKLSEVYEKSMSYEEILLKSYNAELVTQSCGILTGSFYADINSERLDDKFVDQPILADPTNLSSEMTDLTVNWADCKQNGLLANTPTYFDFFNKYILNQ